jgi:hypothetical protein
MPTNIEAHSPFIGITGNIAKLKTFRESLNEDITPQSSLNDIKDFLQQNNTPKISLELSTLKQQTEDLQTKLLSLKANTAKQYKNVTDAEARNEHSSALLNKWDTALEQERKAEKDYFQAKLSLQDFFNQVLGKTRGLIPTAWNLSVTSTPLANRYYTWESFLFDLSSQPGPSVLKIIPLSSFIIALAFPFLPSLQLYLGTYLAISSLATLLLMDNLMPCISRYCSGVWGRGFERHFDPKNPRKSLAQFIAPNWLLYSALVASIPAATTTWPAIASYTLFIQILVTVAPLVLIHGYIDRLWSSDARDPLRKEVEDLLEGGNLSAITQESLDILCQKIQNQQLQSKVSPNYELWLQLWEELQQYREQHNIVTTLSRYLSELQNQLRQTDDANQHNQLHEDYFFALKILATLTKDASVIASYQNHLKIRTQKYRFELILELSKKFTNLEMLLNDSSHQNGQETELNYLLTGKMLKSLDPKNNDIPKLVRDRWATDTRNASQIRDANWTIWSFSQDFIEKARRRYKDTKLHYKTYNLNSINPQDQVMYNDLLAPLKGLLQRDFNAKPQLKCTMNAKTDWLTIALLITYAILWLINPASPQALILSKLILLKISCQIVFPIIIEISRPTLSWLGLLSDRMNTNTSHSRPRLSLVEKEERMCQLFLNRFVPKEEAPEETVALNEKRALYTDTCYEAHRGILYATRDHARKYALNQYWDNHRQGQSDFPPFNLEQTIQLIYPELPELISKLYKLDNSESELVLKPDVTEQIMAKEMLTILYYIRRQNKAGKKSTTITELFKIPNTLGQQIAKEHAKTHQDVGVTEQIKTKQINEHLNKEVTLCANEEIATADQLGKTHLAETEHFITEAKKKAMELAYQAIVCAIKTKHALKKMVEQPLDAMHSKEVFNNLANQAASSACQMAHDVTQLERKLMDNFRKKHQQIKDANTKLTEISASNELGSLKDCILGLAKVEAYNAKAIAFISKPTITTIVRKAKNAALKAAAFAALAKAHMYANRVKAQEEVMAEAAIKRQEGKLKEFTVVNKMLHPPCSQSYTWIRVMDLIEKEVASVKKYAEIAIIEAYKKMEALKKVEAYNKAHEVPNILDSKMQKELEHSIEKEAAKMTKQGLTWLSPDSEINKVLGPALRASYLLSAISPEAIGVKIIIAGMHTELWCETSETSSFRSFAMSTACSCSYCSENTWMPHI